MAILDEDGLIMQLDYRIGIQYISIARYLILSFCLILITACQVSETRSLMLEPEAGDAPRQFPAAKPTVIELPTKQPPPFEARWLVLEWPSKIRLGDTDVVRMSLVMDEGGKLSATAEVAGHQIKTEPAEIPNLYATHNVLAEARLDIAGLEVVPPDLISEPMRPGIPVTFYWSVRPDQIGLYRGSVWLHLRYIPLDGGEESRRLISNQLIEIEGVNLLGLGGVTARVLGGVGVVLGSFLALDNILSWLWKLVNFSLKKRT